MDVIKQKFIMRVDKMGKYTEMDERTAKVFIKGFKGIFNYIQRYRTTFEPLAINWITVLSKSKPKFDENIFNESMIKISKIIIKTSLHKNITKSFLNDFINEFLEIVRCLPDNCKERTFYENKTEFLGVLKAIHSCGFLYVQKTFTKVIFKFYSACSKENRYDVLKEMFEKIQVDESILKRFTNIHLDTFDIDCRLFLNALNRSKQICNIFSVQAIEIYIEDIQVNPPKFKNVNTSFWVDFSFSALSISFYCDPLNPDIQDRDWPLIEFGSDIMDDIFVSIVESKLEFTVFISDSIQVSEENYSKFLNSARKVTLKFPINDDTKILKHNFMVSFKNVNQKSISESGATVSNKNLKQKIKLQSPSSQLLFKRAKNRAIKNVVKYDTIYEDSFEYQNLDNGTKNCSKLNTLSGTETSFFNNSVISDKCYNEDIPLTCNVANQIVVTKNNQKNLDNEYSNFDHLIESNRASNNKLTQINSKLNQTNQKTQIQVLDKEFIQDLTNQPLVKTWNNRSDTKNREIVDKENIQTKETVQTEIKKDNRNLGAIIPKKKTYKKRKTDQQSDQILVNRVQPLQTKKNIKNNIKQISSENLNVESITAITKDFPKRDQNVKTKSKAATVFQDLTNKVDKIGKKLVLKKNTDNKLASFLYRRNGPNIDTKLGYPSDLDKINIYEDSPTQPVQRQLRSLRTTTKRYCSSNDGFKTTNYSSESDSLDENVSNINQTTIRTKKTVSVKKPRKETITKQLASETDDVRSHIASSQENADNKNNQIRVEVEVHTNHDVSNSNQEIMDLTNTDNNIEALQQITCDPITTAQNNVNNWINSTVNTPHNPTAHDFFEISNSISGIQHKTVESQSNQTFKASGIQTAPFPISNTVVPRINPNNSFNTVNTVHRTFYEQSNVPSSLNNLHGDEKNIDENNHKFKTTLEHIVETYQQSLLNSSKTITEETCSTRTELKKLNHYKSVAQNLDCKLNEVEEEMKRYRENHVHNLKVMESSLSNAVESVKDDMENIHNVETRKIAEAFSRIAGECGEYKRNIWNDLIQKFSDNVENCLKNYMENM